MSDIKLLMKECKQLREDGTCSWKDDENKRHCTNHPNMCCAICSCEEDKSCDAKSGICTWLF